MIRRPPRSTLSSSSAASDVYKRQIADSGLNVELKLVWAGDFNDPTKARQVADALIAEGCDVLMGSLNLGMFGVFEAVKSAPEKVLVTAKYTDKSTYAPDNYLTSLIYDFAGPLTAIYNKVQA